MPLKGKDGKRDGVPLPEGLAEEHEALAAISAQGLARAYEDQEPEYSPASIKQPNPDFQP